MSSENMGKTRRRSQGPSIGHFASYRFGHTLALAGWGVFLLWAALMDAVPAGSTGATRSIAFATATILLVAWTLYRPRSGGIALCTAGVGAALILDGSLLFTLLAITAPALFFGVGAVLLHPRTKKRRRSGKKRRPPAA